MKTDRWNCNKYRSECFSFNAETEEEKRFIIQLQKYIDFNEGIITRKRFVFSEGRFTIEIDKRK